MKSVVSEELVSAYFDGEVTVEERLLVERALAESAELRHFYEGLQRLRGGLQLLPRHSLPPDFAARVMARIERERGVQTAPAGEVWPSRRTEVERFERRRPRVWRVFAATAASLAVVALIATWLVTRLVESPTPDGRSGSDVQIAQSPLPGTRVDRLPKESAGADLPDQVTANVSDTDWPKFLVVLDLKITPRGQANRVVENTFEKAGIRFDPSIRVEEELESAVLASRFLGDVERVPAAESSGPGSTTRDEIQMVYVTGGNQIDAALKEFVSPPVDQIADCRFDLAVEPQEQTMFRRLKSAASFAESKDRSAPRAHRLVFRFSLRSVPGVLGTIALPSVRAELAPLANSGTFGGSGQDTAQLRAPSLSAQRSVSSESDAILGESPDAQVDKVFEVLLILRNLKSEPEPAK